MKMLVVRITYIDLTPTNEWIRKLDKKNLQAFLVWKESMDSIKEIVHGLSWKVGNEEQVRVGQDPWVGYNEGFSLSPSIINHLKSRGEFNLSQIKGWTLNNLATSMVIRRRFTP